MSKETFGKTISEIMYKKIEALENLDLKTSLEKDENFEVALCLAYMSLSKEKIIQKDMKNKDRLARLTPNVETSEIEKVFKAGFAKEMPKIIYSKEKSELWILDNIRDSIMHGACDIDEKRKIFIINNNQYDRELNAEVPFSWFIAYAKNDILSKKISDNYTVRSFYYNNDKKNKSYFNSHKEIINNILYRVNVYGNKFNVIDIENRIKELFLLYSNDEVSDEVIEKYREQIDNEKIKYNEKYLVSFYLAKEKVIKTIQQEFPGVTLNIFIDNRKYRLSNKVMKRMPKYFADYDLMMDAYDKLLSQKGISLLRFMSHIIENIDVINEEDNFNVKITKLHKLLTGESISNDKKNNLSIIFDQDLKTMRSIFLSVFGLSTLVINHESLYNSHFLNKNPIEFGIKAYLKQPYLDYANKRKNFIMKLLELEINLNTKEEQFKKCTNEEAKKKIQEKINDLNKNINTIKNDLVKLPSTIGFDMITRGENIDYQNKQERTAIIDSYFYHFYEAKNIEAKKKIRKIIGNLLDVQINEEKDYTYGYCNNMKDVLTIIRNSFSHIGRIYIGKNNKANTNIILNDYDTNGEKSGEVICKYIDLIELLRNPYQVEEQKTI